MTDPILSRLVEFVDPGDLAEFVEACERLKTRHKNGEAAVSVVFRRGAPLQANVKVAGYVEYKSA